MTESAPPDVADELGAILNTEVRSIPRFDGRFRTSVCELAALAGAVTPLQARHQRGRGRAHRGPGTVGAAETQLVTEPVNAPVRCCPHTGRLSVVAGSLFMDDDIEVSLDAARHWIQPCP